MTRKLVVIGIVIAAILLVLFAFELAGAQEAIVDSFGVDVSFMTLDSIAIASDSVVFVVSAPEQEIGAFAFTEPQTEFKLRFPVFKERLRADFDSSGTVDFPDFVLFARNFEKEVSDPDFDSRFDLNDNGVVDFPDFITFARAFNQVAQFVERTEFLFSVSSPSFRDTTFTQELSAGVFDSVTVAVTVVDTLPPDGRLSLDSSAQTVVVRCSDPDSVTIQGTVKNSVFVSGTFAGLDTSFVFKLLPGTYPVALTFTDPAGNIATLTDTLRVADTEPPTITGRIEGEGDSAVFWYAITDNYPPTDMLFKINLVAGAWNSGERQWLGGSKERSFRIGSYVRPDAKDVVFTVWDQAGNKAEWRGSVIMPSGKLVVSVSSVTFSPIYRGASAGQVITISNTGNATLRLYGGNVSGESFTGSFGSFDMAVGQNSEQWVRYNPTTTGTHTGLLSIASDGGNVTISLSGSATEPPPPVAVLSLSTGSLSLGSALIGKSVTGSFTVTNTGNADLSVSAISSSNGQFSASPTSFSLAPGANQSVNITFTPASEGSQSATLSVTSNGGNGTVSVSGTGTLPPPPPVAPTITQIWVNGTQVTPGSIVSVTAGTMAVKVVTTGTEPVTATWLYGATTVGSGKETTISPQFGTLTVRVSNSAGQAEASVRTAPLGAPKATMKSF